MSSEYPPDIRSSVRGTERPAHSVARRSAPVGKGRGVLLPGPPGAAGIRFCCPVRPEPR